MSAGIITVIIVIAAVLVVAVVAGVVYDGRRRRLRQRFGPEYDRLVAERDSKLKAEAELTEREKRVRGLNIRPLDPEAQARYSGEWTAIQERFVDAPQQSVAEAQRLVMAVMGERGYRAEGTDQVLADLSVEHARTLDHFRSAYEISQRAADDLASTEDLRQAMIHFRALFQDLLGPAEAAAPAAEQVHSVPGQGTVVAPEPGVHGAVITEPGRAMGEPGRAMGEPDSAMGEPDSAMAEPNGAVSEHAAPAPDPDAPASQRDAIDRDQETMAPGPRTVTPGRETGVTER